RGEPDVIQSAKSFKGFRSVAGEVRRLLGQAVQPVVDGVDIREIESIRSGDFGYVVVLVAASDAGPHRAMLKNGGDREVWKRAGGQLLPDGGLRHSRHVPAAKPADAGVGMAGCSRC